MLQLDRRSFCQDMSLYAERYIIKTEYTGV